MTTLEQVLAIASALGLGTWLGPTIKEYVKNRGESDIKKIESQSEVAQKNTEIHNLNQEVEKLMETAEMLRLQIRELEKNLKSEREDKEKALQQLASINIAFDIIYIQLRNILGGNEDHAELLNQLKTYIDNGTKNM